jgi:hypothetical protein
MAKRLFLALTLLLALIVIRPESLEPAKPTSAQVSTSPTASPPSGALSLAPLNSTFDEAPADLVPGLTDSKGAATGTPADWAIAESGDAIRDQSDEDGGFAVLTKANAQLSSSAFTLTPDAQEFRFRLRLNQKYAAGGLKAARRRQAQSGRWRTRCERRR